MLKSTLTILVMLGALGLAGCDSGGRGGSGGGDRDSGPIIIPDSGPMVRRDTGPGGGPDSGMPGGECAAPLMAFPAMLAPRCSDATRMCIMGCMDSMCANSCISGDTTMAVDVMGQMVDCGFCIGYTQFFCLDSSGCHSQVAALNCCIEARGCTTDACAMSMCGTEYSALVSCAMGQPQCLNPSSAAFDICYP